jgi:hypothetical protein
MERIGTELARRDRDGTTEWTGLALKWQGEIVIALKNGTDVNRSRVASADTRRKTNIKNVSGTVRDCPNAHKRSIRETVRENVNANRLVECLPKTSGL